MILDILLIINAALVIILALLQSGQSEGLSSAFTGGSGGLNLFQNTKERGAEKIMSQLTLISGISFLVLTVLVRIF